jgi:predicted metalloprotease with PDZ domain
LYIQPVKNFRQIKSRPYLPAFGFNAREVRGELIISHIEIGGMAETAGLKIRDKILCIDNKRFDIKTEGYKEEDFLTYLADKSQIEIQIERNNEIMQFHCTNRP